MTARVLLDELRARGVTIAIEGDHLHLDGPDDVLTDDVIDTLTASKTEVLELLRLRTAYAALTAGERVRFAAEVESEEPLAVVVAGLLHEDGDADAWRDRQERGTVRLLVAIGQRNGSETHVEIYQEAGKPPLLSIALYRRTGAGVLMRDRAHSLRFFRNEWHALAEGVNRAVAELKGRV